MISRSAVRAAVVVSLLLSAGRATAQTPVPPAPALDSAIVRVRDIGPGATGRLLAAALAARHHTIVSDGIVHLPRGASYDRTIVVLRGDVTVASAVQGDVIVVGGDLFLRPGAAISGRAIAIGGGVYNSLLATVDGGRLSYRDHTYDAVQLADGGFALDYRTYDLAPIRTFALPFPAGFRIPSYDRVNGLSLPFGPVVTLDTGRFVIEPLLTYRSHLGAIDPSVRATARRGRRDEATVNVGRTTLTNDSWIRGDVVNSFLALAFGTDVRNYYRADRADVALTRLFETPRTQTWVTVGALTERAWSSGRDSLDTSRSAAFSVFGRDDVENGMLRPNPPVTRGSITSALAGARTEWESGDMSASGAARVEVPFAVPAGRRFVQATLDAEVRFAAFTTHRFVSQLHAVATTGDSTPAQRYTYLGGGGTLPTLDQLSLGGDQLLFVESRYTIPIERLRLPLVGPPSLVLRHMIGSAGVGRLPSFEQNVGVGVAVSGFGVQYLIDPSGRTDSRFGVLISFIR